MGQGAQGRGVHGVRRERWPVRDQVGVGDGGDIRIGRGWLAVIRASHAQNFCTVSLHT